MAYVDCFYAMLCVCVCVWVCFVREHSMHRKSFSNDETTEERQKKKKIMG